MAEFLLSFVVSVAVGALAGLGVGSGGIFMLYLTLFVDMPHKVAQGVNLLFFVFALAGAIPVHLSHYKVPVRILGVIILCGVPGALVGSMLVPHIPVPLLRKCFGGLLIFSGVVTLLRRERKKGVRKDEKKTAECLTNRQETDIM